MDSMKAGMFKGVTTEMMVERLTGGPKFGALTLLEQDKDKIMISVIKVNGRKLKMSSTIMNTNQFYR